MKKKGFNLKIGLIKAPRGIASKRGNSSENSSEGSIKLSAGLTLVELLTSIFIVLLITSIAVYSHREFNDNLEISNLAYAMALSIREAQTSGGAVRGFGGSFEYAYGVHFNINNNGVFLGNNKAYIMFIDTLPPNVPPDPPGNKIYGNDPPGNYPGFLNCDDDNFNPECQQIIDIGRGNFIEKICNRDDSGNLSCSAVNNCNAPTPGDKICGVDLTFLRPRLETAIKFRKQNGSVMNLNEKEAVICLASPLGRKKSIHILRSGQISVEEACP